ncbi:hypothetical protein OIU77_005925 [Salix suchowensis]|uniref:Uncharacterized protein n=1 Tax=Salix suchowensis TaxID=1278906 RepID=A0ABQ9AR48_9ROSI|nr:hypothetical protein OIU77_005925 [Salix suchowensis]
MPSETRKRSSISLGLQCTELIELHFHSRYAIFVCVIIRVVLLVIDMSHDIYCT